MSVIGDDDAVMPNMYDLVMRIHQKFDADVISGIQPI